MRKITTLFLSIVLLFLIYKISSYTESVKHNTIEIKAPVMDVKYEKQMAFDYLNTLRQNAGMPHYFTNRLLDAAAQSHADYLIQNFSTGHTEIPGNSGFTRETPKQRVLHANYQIGVVKENVTTNSRDYKTSVDNLFSAIYHRFGFLDFQTDEIGIGISQDSNDTNRNAFVYDMGIYELSSLCDKKSYDGNAKYVYHVCKDPNHRIRKNLFYKALRFKKSQIKKIVIYPYNKQDDVPPAFYTETPDPLPDLDVSGFPISIQFNDYYFKNIKLVSFSLFDPNNKKIESRLISKQNDPNFRFKANQYALFPLKRLAFDTKYKVVVIYLLNGIESTSSWFFQTRKPQNKTFTIKGDTGTVTIKPNTPYTVYFKPLNPHDTLKTLHFPQGVNAEFIDPNTINLTIYSKNTSSFEVTSGKKVLHVEVTE